MQWLLTTNQSTEDVYSSAWRDSTQILAEVTNKIKYLINFNQVHKNLAIYSLHIKKPTTLSTK